MNGYNRWAIGSAILLSLGFSMSASAQDLLPNMRVQEPFDLRLSSSQLRFSTMSYNVGEGALDVRAGETGSAGQNVYQRIYQAGGGYRDRIAGTFTFHVAHDHIHFDDYFTYTLQPIAAPGASQREGHKTSFCLLDTDKVQGSLPGSPSSAVYATCNADYQGISVGWGDTYGYWLVDQDIDVTGLPNGDYELTMHVDPKNRLREITDDDNTTSIYVRLNFDDDPPTVTRINNPGGDPGDPPPGVEITGISPEKLYRNSVETVTVTGSGFAPGMSVTLENGSGPRPIVRNPRVAADGNSITVDITVKKGGGRRGAVWDVRVGSAVLIDGLTVLR